MSLKVRMMPLMILACLLIAGPPATAQDRHELTFSAGGGSILVREGGGAMPVFSFSYQFHFTKHVSAEGALDFFTYPFLTGPPDNQVRYRDDYTGAEAALVYHFRSICDTGKWVPFVAAGIGKTTTDFTEIPAEIYYRFGAGVAYNFSGRFGVRVEARDEVISHLYGNGGPHGNIPSLRFGIAYRF